MELKSRFDGMIVAGMLCYICLHIELAIRAKSMLMACEFDLEIKVDDSMQDKFAELHSLEKNIRKAGLLAMRPCLNMSRKDL